MIMYKTIKCKNKKSMTSLTDLPNDVLTIILQNVSKAKIYQHHHSL